MRKRHRVDSCAANRLSLIEDGLPAIGSWLPDETLYSLSSRFHSLFGNQRPDQTCLQLFGHAKQGASHDFPARLDEFVARTEGAFGHAEEVAYRRTLLPFYLALRSPIEANNAIASVRVGGLSRVKSQLGILASRFGAAHPLKVCRECMEADAAEHHVAYWHRNHQWPGAMICLTHGAPLFLASGKTNGAGRFHWYLPSDLSPVHLIEGQPAKTLTRRLTLLAECVIGIGTLPRDTHFSPQILRATYLTRMSEMELVRGCSSISAEKFRRHIEQSLGPLSKVRTLEALKDTASSLETQFLRLIRESGTCLQPIRHALLTATLYDSWSDFLECYQQHERSPGLEQDKPQADGEPPALLRTPPDAAHSLSVYVAGGGSVSAAARTFGVSVATAMAWNAAFGQRNPRRPKKLKPDLRDFLVRRLAAGAEKESLATAAKLSIQTVTLLLRTEPGLHEAWQQARLERQRRVARGRWQRTAQRLLRPTASDLRQMQPAVFAWLYRNDRAWLHGFAGQLEKAPRTNHRALDWDARDRDLAESVRQASLSIYTESGGLRATLPRLCDAIPQLKPRLSSLDRLPLTRRAIADAVSKRRQCEASAWFDSVKTNRAYQDDKEAR